MNIPIDEALVLFPNWKNTPQRVTGSSLRYPFITGINHEERGLANQKNALPSGKKNREVENRWIFILVGGWAYPSEKYEFVSWDYEIP